MNIKNIISINFIYFFYFLYGFLPAHAANTSDKLAEAHKERLAKNATYQEKENFACYLIEQHKKDAVSKNGLMILPKTGELANNRALIISINDTISSKEARNQLFILYEVFLDYSEKKLADAAKQVFKQPQKNHKDIILEVLKSMTKEYEQRMKLIKRHAQSKSSPQPIANTGS